jgi:hypothetical protein
MTKKQLQARITELETLVASLNAAVVALSASRTIYVGPFATQPTVNSLSYQDASYQHPYISEPAYPGINTILSSGPQGQGGLQGHCGITEG